MLYILYKNMVQSCVSVEPPRLFVQTVLSSYEFFLGRIECGVRQAPRLPPTPL